MMARYRPEFTPQLFQYPGQGGWVFATVPEKCAPPATHGWGRTPGVVCDEGPAGPQPVGDKLRLVAAEWFMPAEIVKNGPKPRIFDQEMQGPMPGHEPIMPAALSHYDLHVWLWEPNPLGVFEPTNSKVLCPKGGYSHFEAATHGKH